MPKPDLRPDIADAVQKMKGAKLGSGREIRKLADHLAPGETVSRVAAGRYGDGQGLLALTDRRLFFLKDGVMSKTSEDFPFGRVSSVGWRSGVMQGTVTIYAAGVETKITHVFNADGKALVDDAREVVAAGAGVPALQTPPAAAGPDVMGQLRQLAELRDAGVVTAAEFDAKKAQLLARM